MPASHKAEVVRIGELEKHPNADSLSIVQVFGFPVIVRTDAFEPGDLAAYVPADSLVDTSRSEFAFLADKANASGLARIKPIKLRGIFSMGLLVPLSVGMLVQFGPGDDVTESLGVTKYEPPLVTYGAAVASPPPCGDVGYTSIEAFRRYPDLFETGEEIVATEKIHGGNARYVYVDGELHVGSHNRWLKPGESIWHKALEYTPEIELFCRANPGKVLFGEVFGRVQDLRYGRPNSVAFVAFDVFDTETRTFLDFDEFDRLVDAWGVPLAPVVYRGPFDRSLIEAVIEGDSLESKVPGHVMEGVVVRPVREFFDPKFGRKVLKLHSQRYLLRKNAQEVVHA